MKALIWILCLLVHGMITTIFRNSGIGLGAIPTMILYGLAFLSARALCKSWDEHKEEKQHMETLKRYPNPVASSTTPKIVLKAKPTETAPDTWICSKCNSRNLNSRTDCWSCGQKHSTTNSPQDTKDIVAPNVTKQNSYEVVEHLICDNCGIKLPENSIFCNQCGARIKPDLSCGEPPICIDSLFSIEEEHIGKHVQIIGNYDCYDRGPNKTGPLKCHIIEFYIRGDITIDVNLVKPLPNYIVSEYKNYDSPPIILRGVLEKSSSPFYRYVLNQAEYQGYWRDNTGKVCCEKNSCGHECSNDCPIHLNKIGMKKYDEYNRDEALELFNRAIFLAPDYSDAWCNLGYLYLDSQKYNKAYEHFYEAQKHDPKNEKIIYGEIISLAKIGRLKESQELLDKYQKLFPNKSSITLSNIISDAISKKISKSQITDEEYYKLLTDEGFEKFWAEVIAEKERTFVTQPCKYLGGQYVRRCEDLEGFTKYQIEKDINNLFHFRKKLISDGVESASSMLLFDVIDEYDSRYNVIIY